LEREREEVAKQEAERRAREEEKRQEEWLRHQQELQDKLRQGQSAFFPILTRNLMRRSHRHRPTPRNWQVSSHRAV